MTLTEAIPSVTAGARITSVVLFRLALVVRLSKQLFASVAVVLEPNAEPVVRVTVAEDIRVDLRFLPATAAVEPLGLLFALVALDFCLTDA